MRIKVDFANLILVSLFFALGACGGGSGGGSNSSSGEDIDPGESTTNKSWDTPVRISNDTALSASGVSLAMDSDNNVMAVWSQSVFFSNGNPYEKYQIVVSYLMPGGGWSNPERISGSDADYAEVTKVEFDGAGNAIAIWYQVIHDDPSRGQIWTNRYVRGEGWGIPVLLYESTQSRIFSYEPKLAVAPSGKAIAVWADYDAKTLWTCLYTSGSGWSDPEIVGGAYVTLPFEMNVAMNESDNAIVIWRDKSMVWNDIVAMRYTGSTGWSALERLEDSTNTMEKPDIGFDSAGNAIAIWEFIGSGGEREIHSRRYTPSVGWSEPQVLARGSDPELVMNANGTAIAVWHFSNDLHASILSPVSGWSEPASVKLKDIPSYSNIAINDFGDAFVIWSYNGATGNSIWANHYEAYNAWSEPMQLQAMPNHGTSSMPVILIDNSNNAVAAWNRFFGNESQIWGSLYRQ